MATTSDVDLDEVYAFAVQLGKDAGNLLMDAAKARFGGQPTENRFEEKESAVDIVTKTDEGKSTGMSSMLEKRALCVPSQQCS